MSWENDSQEWIVEWDSKLSNILCNVSVITHLEVTEHKKKDRYSVWLELDAHEWDSECGAS